MSSPKTSATSTSATSLPESADGPSLWDALGGRPEDECGAEAAPALPSQRPDERRLARSAQASALSRALEEPESSSASTATTHGTQTGGTCIPSSTASSVSADLQWFISNRLREETDLSGSLEYELAWSESDMLLGPPICRLRASARPTSASDCGDALSGWRSPCAEDGDKGRNSTDSSGASHLTQQAELAGWPTPMAGSPATEDYNEAGNSDFSRKVMELVGWSTPTVQDAENNAGPSQFDRNSHPLNVQAALAGWPTPQARDHFPPHTEEYIAEKKAQGHGMANLNDVALLAGWATPSATTWGDTPESHLERKRKANEAGSAMGVAVTNLDVQAQLAGWVTPRSTDIGRERIPENNQRPGGGMAALEDQVLLAKSTGPTLSSSTAATTSGDESRGVLNPAFSGWLMGFPLTWTYCGLLARRSLEPRKSKAASASSAGSETPSTPPSPPSSSDSQCDGSTGSDDD